MSETEEKLQLLAVGSLVDHTQTLNSSVGRMEVGHRLLRVGRCLLIAFLLCGLLTVNPVAAQADNPVCSDESGTLPSMIEGFIQLTTALGLMGLLVVWQADELAEMFTMGAEKKRRLKDHKRGAMKSASILVLLGPLFTIAGRMMELPVAQCVDLIPF